MWGFFFRGWGVYLSKTTACQIKRGCILCIVFELNKIAKFNHLFIYIFFVLIYSMEPVRLKRFNFYSLFTRRVTLTSARVSLSVNWTTHSRDLPLSLADAVNVSVDTDLHIVSDILVTSVLTGMWS